MVLVGHEGYTVSLSKESPQDSRDRPHSALGIDLGDWPILAEEMDAWPHTIALYRREENFEMLDT